MLFEYLAGSNVTQSRTQRYYNIAVILHAIILSLQCNIAMSLRRHLQNNIT